MRRRRITAQASEAGPPTAPLIRLELAILDRPTNPCKFESFLNVAQEDQARVLAQLAGQDQLYRAFYGDDFCHRFTKIVKHDRQQRQYLDELVGEALEHWHQIPPEQPDFDKAKAEFMRRVAWAGEVEGGAAYVNPLRAAIRMSSR